MSLQFVFEYKLNVLNYRNIDAGFIRFLGLHISIELVAFHKGKFGWICNLLCFMFDFTVSFNWAWQWIPSCIVDIFFF